MTLNMNTIPKFNIKVIDLKNEIDIKNYFFDKNYLKKRNVYWKNSDLEVVGVDFIVSSDFSNQKEYLDLITYYKSIIKANNTVLKSFDVPLIFMGSAFNLNEDFQDSIWQDFPKGRIFIPKILIISNKTEKKILQFDLDRDTKNPILDTLDIELKKCNLGLINETDADNYKSRINKAIKIMQTEDVSKIVLSRKKTYSINSKETLLSHFTSNRCENNTTKFVLDFQELGTVFGNSPEKLFSISNKHLETEAIAGSFKTSQNIDLNQRKKEIEEHNFVVDYLKIQLSNFSKNIKIYDNEIMNLKKISHLRTKLESNIHQNYDVFDIIYKIHPTPAVGGTPKKISIEKISKLENHNRGWYAGTLGWISNKLDAHFIVNIRSGVIKENLLNIYAGCGITKDSNTEEEYNESEMKFDYILSNLNNE